MQKLLVGISILLLLSAPAGAQIQRVTGTGSAGTAATGVVTVQGIASGVGIPVTIASLPLPSGAATAAKQPALGTAGTASTDVLTVQGIASMTPLLVNGSGVTQPVSGTVTANAGTGTMAVSGTFWQATQPVSGTVTVGTFPDNEPINVSQMNGVAVTMGNGASGTGVQRVTLASDSTGQVTLATGSATIGALTANQSVNTAQINGVTPLMGAGNTGTGSPRVTIATDQAALPGLGVGVEDVAETAGGNLAMAGTVRRDTAASSAGTTGDNATLNTDSTGQLWTRTANPCTAQIPTTVAISAAADTVLVTATASQKVYICSISLVAAAAEIVSIWEGTGTVCGTSSAALVGSTTEANGMSFAANGGIAIASPISGITANVDVCLRLSTTNRVSGYLTFVKQ